MARNPIFSKTAIARRNIANIPGGTAFQRQFSGRTVSGLSGIVPFFRGSGGRTSSPLVPSSSQMLDIFKKGR